jgi:hypothetical protein
MDLPKNYLSLIAFLGFGVVLARSGFQGMVPNAAISFSGITIIFVDLALWICERFFRYKKQRKK